MRRAFAAAALALAATCAWADGYRVIDRMPDYWVFEARSEGLDDAARYALFKQLVVAPHPEAYAPGVLGLAADKPYDEQLEARLRRSRERMAGKLPLMRRVSASIAEDLPRYERKFRDTFPDLAYTGDVYFMNALGAFDGATREVQGRTALLFGVDMIAYVYGTDADPQPFFHHELFHIYHSQFAGAGDDATGDTIIGALWQEGLATYVAHALNPKAEGIALFGLPRTMPAEAQARMPELAAELKRLLDSTDKADYARFFLGGRDASRTFPERSGYYAGFVVAERLAQRHSLQDLAHTPVAALRAEIEAALSDLSARR